MRPCLPKPDKKCRKASKIASASSNKPSPFACKPIVPAPTMTQELLRGAYSSEFEGSSMTKNMLSVTGGTKIFYRGTQDERRALDGLNVNLAPADFCIVIG